VLRPPEAAVLRIGLEQAVDCPGFNPGAFSQALGRTASGSTEGHLDRLGHERLQDGVDQRRLAHARAAGDHQDFAGQRQLKRVPLALSQGHAGARLEPGDRLAGVDLGPWRPPGAERAEPLGDGLFAPVQAGEEDAASVLDGVGDHSAILKLEIQRRHDLFGRHLDQLGRELDELVLGQPAMTLVHRLGQSVGDARADADHRLLKNADLHCDLVGRSEADAPDVAREPIGVLADHLWQTQELPWSEIRPQHGSRASCPCCTRLFVIDPCAPILMPR